MFIHVMRRSVGAVMVVVASLLASACVSTQAPVAAKSTGAEWKLVWSDEFAGPMLDESKWTFDVGGLGWGNAEMQFYTSRPENVCIEDGHLVIEAREETLDINEYTSARLKTLGKVSWTYGRFEGRMRIPRGQGIWPAFWLLGENFEQYKWPDCGEIDIMENIGREPSKVHGTIHGPRYSGGEGPTAVYELGSGAFADDFHVFAVEWERDEIRWYVDGKHYNTIKRGDVPGPWVFDKPFFMILNVAVGGNWPGDPDDTSTFPQEMLVDYVRVYQRAQ
jgi:beta-glucanase (GH16 family)